MNYLTALILVGVNMQEDLAFTILVKLMEGEGYELSGMYEITLRKLFEFTDSIYSWLLGKEAQLEVHL
jgi:hypothetical protein